jgi:thymidylate synthase ThyX
LIISNLIRIQVDTCKAHAQEAVKTALDLETTPHYTQNTHYLQTLREQWLAHYKTVRVKHSEYKVRSSMVFECMERESPSFPSSSYNREPLKPTAPYRPYSEVETPQAKALRALVEAGYPNLRVSDLARLLPPDSFEEELVVMADVRAYYHVAYKVSCTHQLHFKRFIPQAAYHRPYSSHDRAWSSPCPGQTAFAEPFHEPTH